MFFFPVKYWCWFNLYLTNYYLFEIFYLVSHLAAIIQFYFHLQCHYIFFFFLGFVVEFLRNKIPLWGQSIESQNYFNLFSSFNRLSYVYILFNMKTKNAMAIEHRFCWVEYFVCWGIDLGMWSFSSFIIRKNFKVSYLL